jgi:biopolymer transport protein ExbB
MEPDALDPEAAAGGAPPAGETARAVSALAEAGQSLAAGGPVVAALLAMSVFALAVILAKAWQFAGAGLAERRACEAALRLWRDGRAAAALDGARRARGPVAGALAAAFARLEAGESEARAREAAWAAASARCEALRGWLRPLEVIAALAPLLGLFGTVLGMIEAFAALEAAGSQVDPAILSGGIWQALLTTAVGLAVAIPAVAAFNGFERQVERAELRAEQAVAALFAPPPREAAAPPPARRSEPVFAAHAAAE